MILQILTSFGLGAIFTAIIQFWLNNQSVLNERKFREKKEAYIGLLEAYRQVAVKSTSDSVKDYAFCEIRCELVGCIKVIEALKNLKMSNANTVERDDAIEKLKN